MTTHTLTEAQRELVASLAERLSRVPGMLAVVLGGSYARGRARPDSDIDLGLLYRPASALGLDEVRAIARDVNDTPDPVVSNFYEWGPWVNGGSWLTIRGQRVDFLYKNIDQLERVIDEAQAGHYEHHFGQHPPFGFYSDTYLAELQTCVPLYDRDRILPALQQRVAVYPEALRRRLLQNSLGSATFDLYSASKAAEAEDAYLTNACCIRILNHLVHGLFALNRRYRVNDKSAFAELTECPLLPADFAARAHTIASRVGVRRAELLETVERVRALVAETSLLGADALVIDADTPAWLRQMKQVTGT
jgi:predicted nucleotidyltransferase